MADDDTKREGGWCHGLSVAEQASSAAFGTPVRIELA